MVIICLILLETAKYFFRGAVPFYFQLIIYVIQFLCMHTSSLSIILSFFFRLKDPFFHHNLSIWALSFNLSLKVSHLQGTSSFSFPFCENIFVSHTLTKDSFTMYRILCWQLFSPSALNMTFLCFLDSIISIEKSASCLISLLPL